MDLAKRFFPFAVFMLLCACSSTGTSKSNDDYDSIFREMVAIPLNEHFELATQHNAESDTLTIYVESMTEQDIWSENQSFGVEGFVFNQESRQWKVFDLGFSMGGTQPEKILHDILLKDTYYTIPAIFAGLKETVSLRLLVTGCLDEPCHPGSTRVGAYIDVVVGPMGDQSATASVDNPDEQRIHRSFLLETDLPAGWFRGHFDTVEVEGDTVYLVVFLANDQPGLENLTHQIILYPDETQAKEAYRGKWTQSKQDSFYGKTIPEISFHSRADAFRIGCLYSTSELYPQNLCIAVARYNRMISILTTTTYDEEQWFSWADLERVLGAMDRRALEAAGH